MHARIFFARGDLAMNYEIIFANVYELLALLCGSTYRVKTIHFCSFCTSCYAFCVSSRGRDQLCLRNEEHLLCQQPLDMRNEIVDDDWRISILSIMPF